MHSARIKSIQDISQRTPRNLALPEKRISEYFGSMTFSTEEIKKRISEKAFEEFQGASLGDGKLSEAAAEEIAQAVKDWALEKHVTHFTHWFQPLTGLTAEKHDSFLSTSKDGKVLEKFNAAQLIQSEPDASSFPNGGMRSTFEARGYTAWDLSSPMFIVEKAGARILCIPSAFVSYTGHSLDTKISLLRSMKLLSQNAVAFLNEIGDQKTTRINCTIGCEQEYFLVDEAFYNLRPDLIMSGRTLQGALMARGQQLEDHYFGSIPSRVLSFMAEAESELYALGIPCKTRHNEVAPSQFEIAPIFEQANVAADHNMLMMEVLKRTAEKHKLVCLFHEKPFAEINGSGKHNNWSIATDTGENLLEPGKTPQANIRFLAVLSCVLKAVFKNQVALRAAIASHGNDHRLGANEAPPAIISVFLGETLSKILDALEKGEDLAKVSAEQAMMDFSLHQLPLLPKDNTDRNRTSPFAFTGNKFEFRAVGSSQSISFPGSLLNTGVALAMQEFTSLVAERKKDSVSVDSAILSVVKEFTLASKAIRFEGNGYSDEWKKEAKSKGLFELLNTPDSLSAFLSPEHHSFLTESGVFSKEEIHTVIHVRLERYAKHIAIEANTLSSMFLQNILPAVNKYEVELLESQKNNDGRKSYQGELLKKIQDSALKAYELNEALAVAIESAQKAGEGVSEAQAFAEKVFPLMESLRVECDKLENLTPDEYWSLPKYREMLFIR